MTSLFSRSFFFLTMTTLYSHLLAYYKSNPSAIPLTHLQKSKFGSLVASSWHSVPGASKLTLTKSVEESGEFTVVQYPDGFSNKIDELIGDFYASLVVKKRERKKHIPKKVWSSKPTIPNGNI